jgi:Kef-type K+ transport system membrane component KefB
VDPVAHVLLALTIILAAAKIAGHVSVRLGQPAVLGELLAGVVLANLRLAGVDAFHRIADDPTVDILARLGVVILLFEVGLESTVRDMFKVGWPSLFVAVLGVVAPFALGWGVSAWLLPDRGPYVHAFLGATLTATSVGITARVLKDLDRSRSPEARVILGAAVIDDVLGLVILAVVSGVITSADRGEQQIEHLLHPISAFLVPVFFVFMGMHVDLTAFARVDVLGLSALLTVAAILGKQACCSERSGRSSTGCQSVSA